MNHITEAVQGVARDWRKEAERRRSISKADPVADTLEYCAGEVVARVRSVGDADNLLTVEQYAAQPDVGVTAQTVRKWIRLGQLAAIETPKGYRVRKDAKRVVNLRRAS